jgi:hypothetical protein
VTRSEWYAISDEFIHEGHDRALLYFYPLDPVGGPQNSAGGGLRFRPPARVRVEAWCRAAMDAHLRRSMGGVQPGPIITHIRCPFVADLGPSGSEVIVWERPHGGLRAMTLLMHRGEWGWIAVPHSHASRRLHVSSSIG